MKTRLLLILCAFVLPYVVPCPALADDAAHHPPPYKGSPAFEMLKGLDGNWEGTVEHAADEKEKSADEKTTASYRVTSNGSAVIETIFKGTPMEMTSMYFEKDGKLMMTHYCAMGNRPTMALKKETKESLTFDYASGENLNVKKDPHIHGLTLEKKPDGSLVQRWQGFAEGKPMPPTVLILKRAS